MPPIIMKKLVAAEIFSHGIFVLQNPIDLEHSFEFKHKPNITQQMPSLVAFIRECIFAFLLKNLKP